MGVSNTVNNSIKSFFIKLFLLAFSWKIIQMFVLTPIRIPDMYLTNMITIGTVHLTNFLHFLNFPIGWMMNPNNSATANSLTKEGISFFYIDDTCNGLDIMMIYIGILALIPHKSIQKKLLFILIGLIVLIIANIIRCTALLWIYLYHHTSFDFNHHYVFTFIMYGIIISGWLLFLKKDTEHEIK